MGAFRLKINDDISTPKGRIAPKNLSISYLLSAGYDGKAEKAFLRLYEPNSQQIFLWYDNTSHLSYCISKEKPEDLRKNEKLINYPDFLTLEKTRKFDSLVENDIEVTKVVATNPLAIGGGLGGGIRNIIGESWESRIRYYQNYIYDMDLIPGMPYRIEQGNLKTVEYVLPDAIKKELEELLVNEDEEFKENVAEWARLLQCPIPDVRRVAVDIEVYATSNKVPNPDEAIEQIIAVSFVSSDGLKRVILLSETDEKDIPPKIEDAEVLIVNEEKTLIEEIFKILNEYPIVLTFNGDNFDLRYLRQRATNLAFTKDEIPITVGRRFAYLRNG